MNGVGKRKLKRQRRLRLHERLLLPLPPVLREWGDEFRAVKWIGNEASHTDEILIASLFDAFEILDVACHALFDESERRVRRRAKAINRRNERK
jgi:hypothetical protein